LVVALGGVKGEVVPCLLLARLLLALAQVVGLHDRHPRTLVRREEDAAVEAQVLVPERLHHLVVRKVEGPESSGIGRPRDTVVRWKRGRNGLVSAALKILLFSTTDTQEKQSLSPYKTVLQVASSRY